MMTDKELVYTLRKCACSNGTYECAGCPLLGSKRVIDCTSSLMLEAADRIAAGMTLRKDDSHG